MLTVRHVAALGILTLATATAAGTAVTVDDASRLRSVTKETFLPGFADRLGDVGAIRITRGGGFDERSGDVSTVTLTRTDDRWAVAEREAYPARGDAVRALLLGLSEAERLEPKTADPERFDRLSLRDVSEPGSRATRVLVEDTTGRSVLDVLIGKSRTNLTGGKGLVYARLDAATDDASRAWLIQGDMDVRGGPSEWIDRTVMDLPRGDIAAARLVASDGSELILQHDGDHHVIETVPEDLRVRSIYAVDNVAAGLADLVTEDVRPRDGLEPDDALGSATFISYNGLIIDVRFAEVRPSLEAQPVVWSFFSVEVAEGAPEGAEAAAVELRNRLDGWAYNLGQIRTSRLRETLDSLTDPRS